MEYVRHGEGEEGMYAHLDASLAALADGVPQLAHTRSVSSIEMPLILLVGEDLRLELAMKESDTWTL